MTRPTRTSAGDPSPTSTLVTSHGGWAPPVVTGPHIFHITAVSQRGLHGIRHQSLHPCPCFESLCSLTGIHTLANSSTSRTASHPRFSGCSAPQPSSCCKPPPPALPKAGSSDGKTPCPSLGRHSSASSSVASYGMCPEPPPLAEGVSYYIQMAVGIQWDSVSKAEFREWCNWLVVTILQLFFSTTVSYLPRKTDVAPRAPQPPSHPKSAHTLFLTPNFLLCPTGSSSDTHLCSARVVAMVAAPMPPLDFRLMDLLGTSRPTPSSKMLMPANAWGPYQFFSLLPSRCESPGGHRPHHIGRRGGGCPSATVSPTCRHLQGGADRAAPSPRHCCPRHCCLRHCCLRHC